LSADAFSGESKTVKNVLSDRASTLTQMESLQRSTDPTAGLRRMEGKRNGEEGSTEGRKRRGLVGNR